jgi:hypothetical protein
MTACRQCRGTRHRPPHHARPRLVASCATLPARRDRGRLTITQWSTRDYWPEETTVASIKVRTSLVSRCLRSFIFAWSPGVSFDVSERHLCGLDPSDLEYSEGNIVGKFTTSRAMASHLGTYLSGSLEIPKVLSLTSSHSDYQPLSPATRSRVSPAPSSFVVFERHLDPRSMFKSVTPGPWFVQP